MSKPSRICYIFSFLSFFSFFVIRFLIGGWVPFLWVCLGLMVLLLGIGLWYDRILLKQFFAMKTTRQGLSMGYLTLMVLVLLIVVNFVAVRKYKTFDFSPTQVNTLSEQSVKLLGELKSELQVLYFYKKGDENVEQERRAFIEIMKKYQDQSSLVKLEFVDVNERPDLTEKYAVTTEKAVFLEYEGRKNQIQKIDEQDITSALVKVTRTTDKKVYLTVGHAEKDPDDAQSYSGLNAFSKLLEGNRYIVKTLNLIEKPVVPDDADVVMIIGPTQGFLDSEVTALEAYLKAGGSLVVAVEPKAKNNLNRLFQLIGARIDDNYVVNFVDTSIGRAVNPQATAGRVFSMEDPITKPFGKNQVVLFTLPTSVGAVDKLAEGFVTEPLVSTGPESMAYPDTNFKGEGKVNSFVIAQAFKGKLGGKVGEKPDGKVGEKPDAKLGEKEFHVVVFGDSDFFTNKMLYQNLNRDLALNTVSSLAKEEGLVSITPKEIGVTQMVITPTQWSYLIIPIMFLIPLSLLGTGAVFWLRRRHA